MATPLTSGQFFTRTNGRARTRLFDDADYARYCRAYAEAQTAALAQSPYYATDDAGGVANRYGYATTTAQWGVWTTNAGKVVSHCDRPTIFGRTVQCPYYGGERRYQKDFCEGRVGVPVDEPLPPMVPSGQRHGADPETCTACQGPLEGIYYTGKTWGETLCEPCYEARVQAGAAKPALNVEDTCPQIAPAP